MNLPERIPAEYSMGEMLELNERIPAALQDLAGQFCQFLTLLEAQPG